MKVGGDHRSSILAALLVLVMPAAQCAEPGLGVDLYARAYFESGYMSSGGLLTYTEPVAEQYALAKFRLGRFGRIATDAWLCSALNAQTDGVHRRAFYILEETLTYGYDFQLSENFCLASDAGVLWDWLWGYKEPQDMPIAWYAQQYLRNPWVTPYWNGLGFFYPSESVRIRFGLEHQFSFFGGALRLTPFADTTFGDKNRYAKNFGAEPESDFGFFGGAFMTITFGSAVEWRFSEHWSVWGRYRQYMLLDEQARDVVAHRRRETDEKCFPIFSLGLCARF